MTTPKPVLLTVSGRIPTDLDAAVVAGRRPRADYRVMSDAFDAELVDVEGALHATGLLGRVLHRLGGPGALLGWYCFRRRRKYQVIVTDGEQVGLPLALLGRLFGRGSARHMMVVHVLSTPTKAWLIRVARLANMIDRYVVYCSWQRDFIHERLSVPADRILLTTFMVDTKFFDPSAVGIRRERMICSAGLERRDYATLMRAVDGLDVHVVVAAASPWSTQSDSSSGVPLPGNVTIQRLNLFELRELYARSLFVVMPLEPVDFQAGITTILEGLSMARPVVCTRTPGQTDTVIEGQTGCYVAPADASALRAKIVSLLDDPAEAEWMGDRAREWVLDNADLERYADRLARVVTALRRDPGEAVTE